MQRHQVSSAMNRIDRGSRLNVTIYGGTTGTIELAADHSRYAVTIRGTTTIHERPIVMDWLGEMVRTAVEHER